ncbi:MAG: class I SAM-dependent methyltransferase [Thermosynechococcaceae cyanobacterium MS004]|nr:class I SAM-dependent methyltransferase [Thermosynechococcaceae cyanobacterium MS004]
METKIYWEAVYEAKDSTEVSWFQEHPEISLQFIERTGVDNSVQVIDVGGGASTLVDDLLDRGYRNITVLDISSAALQVAQERLGSRANAVTWLEADITQVELPYKFYDVWHDRAVFHFLTRAADRQKYVEAVMHSVKEGGHVIVATFGVDGPSRCSGLEVVRYSPDSLHDEFGNNFDLVDSTSESHKTPFGTEQKFIYCYCRKG